MSAPAPAVEPGELAVAALLGMAAPYNPRTIAPDEFEALRRSIRFFGFVEPVVVNRRLDHVVGGHQRIKAAHAEGYAALPVVFVDLDDPSEKQLNLALNKISGEWDDEKLAALLRDLRDGGADLALTGFSEDDLAGLLAEPPKTGLTDPDDAPETPERAVSAPGDVWVLGAHRLVCGDAREGAALAALLGSHQVDLVLTDPPYNVDYEGGTSAKLRITNDQMASGAFFALLHRSFATMRQHAKAGAAVYVFHADTEGANFRRALVEAGWKLAQCCVWVKQSLVLSRQDYHWQHEPVLYGWNPEGAHRWYADRKQTTVWHFDRPARSELHPTMKPVAMLEYILGNSSRGGDLVLDSFAGAGSTLIACEILGRAARLVELDPRYCDVILRRWQEFSGEEARHEASGQTLAQRAAANSVGA